LLCHLNTYIRQLTDEPLAATQTLGSRPISQEEAKQLKLDASKVFTKQLLFKLENLPPLTQPNLLALFSKKLQLLLAQTEPTTI